MIIQLYLAEGIEYMKFHDFTKAHNNATHDHLDTVSQRDRIFQIIGLHKGT